MFYYASKIIWFVVNPATIFAILALATCILCFTPWVRARRVVAGITGALIVFVVAVPVGGYVNAAIENRFPANPPLPDDVHGIIVLGGAVDPERTRSRGQFTVGGSFDRVIIFAELAERYPEARLVYSGGSHAWIAGEGEAAMVAPLLRRLGVDTDRVLFEADSRNTHQNAVMAKALADPKADEHWILITSGYHMPRAMGSFRHAGWPAGLIAYPVDFRFPPDYQPTWFSFNLTGRLGVLSGALREVLGMTAYYVTDRSDSLFPGPVPPD
ncbi:MAG: YdcF family protein [Rhodospirillales bacterium]